MTLLGLPLPRTTTTTTIKKMIISMKRVSINEPQENGQAKLCKSKINGAWTLVDEMEEWRTKNGSLCFCPDLTVPGFSTLKWYCLSKLFLLLLSLLHSIVSLVVSINLTCTLYFAITVVCLKNWELKFKYWFKILMQKFSDFIGKNIYVVNSMCVWNIICEVHILLLFATYF